MRISVILSNVIDNFVVNDKEFLTPGQVLPSLSLSIIMICFIFFKHLLK
jgi:hypothetical protein